jgi:hypothetical protein
MPQLVILYEIVRFLAIALWTLMLHTVETVLDRWVSGAYKRGHRSRHWRILHRIGRSLRHIWHMMPGQKGILIPPTAPCRGCPQMRGEK